MDAPDTIRGKNDVVRSLVRALDLHGPGEAEHAERVSVYSVATADQLGFSEAELLLIRWAAQLHDVGKIQVNADLVSKLGALTEEELMELKLHATHCDHVLASYPWLAPALPWIRHHHERWDGTGYPEGLAGKDIPLGARVIGLAETFDLLCFGSFWKQPVGREAALHAIQNGAGTHFDPVVVDAFSHVEVLIQPLDVF